MELLALLIVAVLDQEANIQIETGQQLYIQVRIDGRDMAAVNSVTKILLDARMQFTLENVSERTL